jgi:hypothetical protein
MHIIRIISVSLLLGLHFLGFEASASQVITNCQGSCYYIQTSAGVNNPSIFESFSEFDGVTESVSSVDGGFSAGALNFFVTGRGEANLSTGTLKAFASSNYASSGYAAFGDEVRFILPLGQTSTFITVDWSLTGQNDYRAGGSNGNGAYFRLVNYGRGESVEFSENDPRTSSNVAITQNGIFDLSYSAPFQVFSNGRYRIDSYLRATVNGSGTSNFGNSASFNFRLPEGVSIASGSGVLLSSTNTAAVPEPATWAMMLLGFGFVGGVMRNAKRRQRVTVCYA